MVPYHYMRCFCLTNFSVNLYQALVYLGSSFVSKGQVSCV